MFALVKCCSRSTKQRSVPVLPFFLSLEFLFSCVIFIVFLDGSFTCVCLLASIRVATIICPVCTLQGIRFRMGRHVKEITGKDGR